MRGSSRCVPRARTDRVRDSAAEARRRSVFERLASAWTATVLAARSSGIFLEAVVISGSPFRGNVALAAHAAAIWHVVMRTRLH